MNAKLNQIQNQNAETRLDWSMLGGQQLDHTYPVASIVRFAKPEATT